MCKYWPRGIVGETGFGDDNLVFIETLSKVDSDGLIKSSTLFDIVWSMYALRIRNAMDTIRTKEKETGRQWALIHVLDLEGLVFDHKLLTLISGHYKILAQLYTDHSVEMNRKIIAVNVPNFLHHLFNLVKCFIPERTRKKLIVLGLESLNVYSICKTFNFDSSQEILAVSLEFSPAIECCEV
uniref:CRAL-TRIO domain-containing protein n=1 Tax=Romanomermis culicivorax TaxID=13658 RepID=A0A915KHY8_ROMCU